MAHRAVARGDERPILAPRYEPRGPSRAAPLKELIPIGDPRQTGIPLMTLSALVVGFFVACGGTDTTPQPDGGTEVDAGTPDADTPDTGIAGHWQAGRRYAGRGHARHRHAGRGHARHRHARRWGHVPVAGRGAARRRRPDQGHGRARGALAHGDARLVDGSRHAHLDHRPRRGLTTCTGATDVFQLFFDYLNQSPDLFQIDPTEWHTNGPLPVLRGP